MATPTPVPVPAPMPIPTLQIIKVGDSDYSDVFTNDFFGAMRSGYVNSVNDVIQINGTPYILSSVLLGGSAARPAPPAAQPAAKAAAAIKV